MKSLVLQLVYGTTLKLGENLQRLDTELAQFGTDRFYYVKEKDGSCG